MVKSSAGVIVSGPILVVVNDLIFLSKIQQTAQQVGVAVEVVDPLKIGDRIKTSPACSVILDLNHRFGAAVETARALKANHATQNVQVVAFLSHVQGELAAAARAAGCDMVMARSAFAQQLPELLLKLAG